MAVPLVDPDDPVLVHVVNYGDIFIALSVSGLIHTYAAYIIVDAERNVRLKPRMGCLDAVPDSAPVNALEFTDGTLAHLADHPGNFVIECGGEPAGSISPWDELVKGSMLRAEDSLGAVENIHRAAIKVRSSPAAFFFHLVPVHHALLPAHRAEALGSLKWPGMDYYGWLLVCFTVCLVRAGPFLAFFYVHEVEV